MTVPSADALGYILLPLRGNSFTRSEAGSYLCRALFRANWEDASKCADDSRWARQFPHVPVLERPCVHGASITHQVENPGFAQLLRRPFVQALQPWPDDPVVQHLAERVFLGDILMNVTDQRVPIGHNAREGQEDSCHG